MFNKTKSVPPSIFFALMLSAVLISHSLSVSSNAHSSQSINFYLPIDSKQFPELISQLQQAFEDNGLNEINVISADYWQAYQQSIRYGRVGIYYAAPHFTAWAIEHHDFQTLLRTKGNLKYVIASQYANSNIFEIRDLVGKTVCTQSALNLDYLLVVQTFEKSLQPANIQTVTSIESELNSSETPCSAFSISEHLFSAQQIERPDKHIRLSQGPEYTNFAISIHPSLAPDYSDQLISFFQQESTLSLLEPLIKLSSNETSFTTPDNDDYPANYYAALKRYWKN